MMSARSLRRAAVVGIGVALIGFVSVTAAGISLASDSTTYQGSDGKHLHNLAVVLFDISRSTGPNDVRAIYRDGFRNKILPFFDHGEGGLLVLAPITADSIRSFNPLEYDYPHKGGNDNPLVYRSKTRELDRRATERANAIIGGPRERNGTAILDALTAAGRYLHRRGETDHRYLVLFSDMVEQSPRGSFTRQMLTPAGTAAFIKKERSSPYFPRLSGADVYVVGAGVGGGAGAPNLPSDRIERFWQRYIAAAGGHLDPDNYGPSLIEFP